MVQSRDLIALLALDDSGRGICANRVRYAGTPVILRQVDMALALGCQALIVMAAGPDDGDALAAQHLAEANGMRFHLLARPQQLPALMGDRTDLILIAPGTLARDIDLLEELLGSNVLLTIPAESDDAKELERLDLHTAWGGALRMPGALVGQIEPLGNECELLSALPRIARSSGVKERPVAASVIENGLWVLGSTNITGAFAGAISRDISDLVITPISHFFGMKNWSASMPIAAALGLMIIAALTLWFERYATGIAVLAGAMLSCSLFKAVRAQAEPLRLSGGASAVWTGILGLVPEAFAAIVASMALAQKGDIVPAAYAAAALLGASWLSRKTSIFGYEGITSGPAFWLAVAGMGALGLWWTAIGVGTAAAFGAIAVELRGLRRITRS